MCPEHRIADAVVCEALSWLGTPYRHQASRKAVGCDCIGLVRGVWRALYGREMERPGAYAPDWAEAGGEKRLLEGARRHFHEKPLSSAAPGDLLIFRWRPHLAAKHAGIMMSEKSFIHAYEGGGVVTVSALVPQWRRRIAAVFTFPDP
ncbi:NlpC/P60 family protein [Manganibacter manganicus]|uniref:NlpC/P60 family protein n=1 Tax=Manganibacter manganicus TaxID=1873176 RepID=UPI001FD95E65|nr:NlpC/P60 family protein [Pseudaminobacter manganicus]